MWHPTMSLLRVSLQLLSFWSACFKLSPYTSSSVPAPRFDLVGTGSACPRSHFNAHTLKPHTLQSITSCSGVSRSFQTYCHLTSSGTFLPIYQAAPPSVSPQCHLSSTERYSCKVYATPYSHWQPLVSRDPDFNSFYFATHPSMLFFTPITWPDCFHF